MLSRLSVALWLVLAASSLAHAAEIRKPVPANATAGRWRLTFNTEFGNVRMPLNTRNGGLFVNEYVGIGHYRTFASSTHEAELMVDPEFRPNAAGTSGANADAPSNAATPRLGINPFSFASGALNISAIRTPEAARAAGITLPYLSGMLSTEETFCQTYGYFEMRARLPAGAGLWPAFWLYGLNTTKHEEIDIVEAINGIAYQSVHFAPEGSPSSAISSTHGTELPEGLSDRFHTYAVEWTPATISFFIDGHRTHEVRSPFSGLYLVLHDHGPSGWWAAVVAWCPRCQNLVPSGYVHCPHPCVAERGLGTGGRAKRPGRSRRKLTACGQVR